jgi:hypothetical protein
MMIDLVDLDQILDEVSFDEKMGEPLLPVANFGELSNYNWAPSSSIQSVQCNSNQQKQSTYLHTK